MKLLFFILFLSLALQGSTQSTDSTKTGEKESLLQKSKKQKTGAFLLLGGGAVITVIGTAIMSARAVDEVASWFNDDHDSGFAGGMIVFLVGVTSMAGSIPLFIAASKNKRRALAASAFIRSEQRPIIRNSSMVKTSIPAIGISLKF